MKEESANHNKMEVDEDYNELYAHNKANLPLRTVEVSD